jgi:hypothetical protein
VPGGLAGVACSRSRPGTADLPAPKKVGLENNALFSTDPQSVIQRFGPVISAISLIDPGPGSNHSKNRRGRTAYRFRVLTRLMSRNIGADRTKPTKKKPTSSSSVAQPQQTTGSQRTSSPVRDCFAGCFIAWLRRVFCCLCCLHCTLSRIEFSRVSICKRRACRGCDGDDEGEECRNDRRDATNRHIRIRYQDLSG